MAELQLGEISLDEARDSRDLSSRQGEQVTPVAQSRGAEGRVPGDCLSLSAGKGGIEVDRSLYDADHTHSVMGKDDDTDGRGMDLFRTLLHRGETHFDIINLLLNDNQTLWWSQHKLMTNSPNRCGDTSRFNRSRGRSGDDSIRLQLTNTNLFLCANCDPKLPLPELTLQMGPGKNVVLDFQVVTPYPHSAPSKTNIIFTNPVDKHVYYWDNHGDYISITKGPVVNPTIFELNPVTDCT